MFIRYSLILFVLGMVGISSSNAALNQCRSFYSPELSGIYRLTFEDLANMSIEIESMVSSAEKLEVVREFRAKYKELQSRLGFSIKPMLEKRVADLKGSQKKEKEEKDLAKNKVKQSEEDLLRFIRTKSIPFKTGSPESALFYNETTVIYPQKDRIVFWDIQEGKEVFSQVISTIRPNSELVLSNDKTSLYIIRNHTIKISLPSKQEISTWNDLEVRSTPNTRLKAGQIEEIYPSSGALSPDGKYLIQTGDATLASVKDAQTLEEVFNFYENLSGSQNVQFSKSSHFALINHRSGGNQILLDLRSMTLVENFNFRRDDNEKDWTDGQFLPNSEKIIYATKNAAIRIYDPVTRSYEDVFSNYKDSATFNSHHGRTLVISEDGKIALVAVQDAKGQGSTFAVINLETKKEIEIESAPIGWTGNAQLAPRQNNQVAFVDRFSNKTAGKTGITWLTIFDFNLLKFRTVTVNKKLWNVVSWLRPTGQFSSNNDALILAADSIYEKEIVYVY